MTSTLIDHAVGGRRVRRSADDWRQIIERQRASGLTQSAFCEREGLAVASFCKWLARLRDDSEELATDTVSFVSVDRSVSDEDGIAVLVRLDLGSGMVLEVSRR